VCEQRPADNTLLVKSIEVHRQKLGRTPHMVATDAGFFSAHNEADATKMGVKRVAIPNRSTKKRRAAPLTKETMVSPGTGLANGMRRPDQRAQKTTRFESLSIPRR